jgi:hypothetical protein
MDGAPVIDCLGGGNTSIERLGNIGFGVEQARGAAGFDGVAEVDAVGKNAGEADRQSH